MSESEAHPRWSDVYGEGEEPLTNAQKDALDTYLKIFTLAPRDDIRGELCPHCFNHAAIEWGLCNGEAFCINCGWPYRVYHRDIGGTDGIQFLNYGLPYHPSCVEAKSTEKEASDAADGS